MAKRKSEPVDAFARAATPPDAVGLFGFAEPPPPPKKAAPPPEPPPPPPVPAGVEHRTVSVLNFEQKRLEQRQCVVRNYAVDYKGPVLIFVADADGTASGMIRLEGELLSARPLTPEIAAEIAAEHDPRREQFIWTFRNVRQLAAPRPGKYEVAVGRVTFDN